MASDGIDRYGVMGYPISHSRSPVIHRLFALQTGQDMQYELLRVAPNKLESAVSQFQRTGGLGLNITLPHKSEILPLVDQVSDRARSAGAVNTLAFQDGEIFGDNTDGVGLVRDLITNLGWQIRDADILILGAGGATRGIVAPLLGAEPKSITIANRTLPKARDLESHFSTYGPVSACRFDDVMSSKTYDLIINADLEIETHPMNVHYNTTGQLKVGKLFARTFLNSFLRIGDHTPRGYDTRRRRRS